MVGLQGSPGQKERPHTIRMIDLGRNYAVHLKWTALEESRGRPGDWCWHIHLQRNTVKFFAHGW